MTAKIKGRSPKILAADQSGHKPLTPSLLALQDTDAEDGRRLSALRFRARASGRADLAADRGAAWLSR